MSLLWQRLALMTLSTALLVGCAALPTPGAPSDAVAAQVDVQIDAPDELIAVLQKHLDLTRLAVLAPGERLADSELRRLVAATPAQARALLATEGYMAAEVSVEREPAPTEDALPRWVVRVTPGRRTQVTHVQLDLQGPLVARALSEPAATDLVNAWRRAWPLGVGKAFSNSAWRDAKSASLARLRAAGYSQATWRSTDADIDADQAQARLRVEADSGPLFRVGRIDIVGLERQHENSVRHLADFPAGTAATEALLMEYQERLQRTGLFEGVSVTLDTDPAQADAATVTVRVRELPLQQATMGVGISANTGARVTLEHLHRRVLGQRATLRNKLEWGELRQAWEGELSSHTLPGLYRNLLGGAGERLESDTDVVRSFRLRLGRSYETQAIERLVFVEGERVVTDPKLGGAAADSVGATTIAATINFHGNWRYIDNMVLPTEGVTWGLQTGLGRVHETSGDGGGSFSRVFLRAKWWQPLGRDWYFQARAEVGQVFAADSVQVPETQRFRAGGDDSVRGYAYRSLTPQVAGVDVGGRVLGSATLEIARPVSVRLPSVWWATFVDAGNAADRWGDFKAEWGAGFGIRWRSPVGPLRADVAYGEAVRQWRLHLSVGIAF